MSGGSELIPCNYITSVVLTRMLIMFSSSVHVYTPTYMHTV